MTKTKFAMIDGRDALFGLIVKQAPDDPDGVFVDTFGAGLSPRGAAEVCRQMAARLDTLAEERGEP